MANSKEAFLFVMGHEDSTMSGVVTKDNNGGEVRFGVNSIANPQAVTDGFYQMPKDEAVEYAHNLFVIKYWNPIYGDSISDQRVANQFADLSYVSGDESVMIIQRAVNQRGGELAVDGMMGSKTLNGLNAYINQDALTMLDAVKAQAIMFYQLLTKKNPAEYTPQIYLSWVRRLNA
jgi:lysozyme family protein